MSRFINKIKKHKKAFVIAVFVFISAGFVLFKLYLISFLVLLIAVLNYTVVRKMDGQNEAFSPRGRIRNIDTLIIGDVSNDAKKKLLGKDTGICINSPCCSLTAAYELLRHSFSILKENNGKAIIVVKKMRMKKSYNLFDVRFFHAVTISRLNLKKFVYKCYFPMIFEPFLSIRFLLGIGCKELVETKEIPKELYEFCVERNINLVVLTKKNNKL